MHHALLAALLAVPQAAAPAAPGTATDAELARALVRVIEEHHARTTDLVARFSQSYRSGLLGREIVERGVVSFKRPGRMRWEYKDPEAKLFVSDGKTFYFYVPADRQVVVSEQDDQRSLATRLLSGKGGLLDEFTATLDEPLEEGVLRLRLVPRQPQPDVERAVVVMRALGDAGAGATVRRMDGLGAGLRIRRGLACVDATVPGLLASRERIESELLAELDALLAKGGRRLT